VSKRLAPWCFSSWPGNFWSDWTALRNAKVTYRTSIAEAQKQSNDHAAGEMTGFLQELQ